MSGEVPLVEVLVSVLIVIGSGFALVGSWGLVRLPSLMERLHGPTKASTLGLGAMLGASLVYFQLLRGVWTTHELLISLFLFVTAPISANMIAKAHLHRMWIKEVTEPVGPAGVPAPPASDTDWATHEAPHPGTPGDFSED